MLAAEPPGRVLAIGAVDRAWARARGGFDDAVERDPADLGRRHYHAAKTLDARSKRVDRTHADLILVVTGVEGRRFLAGDECIERL